MVMQYGKLFLEIRNALMAQEEQGTAAMMARYIISEASGLSRMDMLVQGRKEVPQAVIEKTNALTQRVLGGEPFAYVLGNWEFYGLPLIVTPDVLIPRDDTCTVTALAIEQCMLLDPGPRVLDLCCGSGCIGLAVASRIKDARVTLGDLSKEALAVAKKNIALNHMGGRVSAMQVNAMEPPAPFLGKFDLIVSNPPYITAKEMEELPPSVADYEPHMALFGGEDGLDFYRSIGKHYKEALQPGGYLALEYGADQAKAVRGIVEKAGFTVLDQVRDDNGRDRALLARLPAPAHSDGTCPEKQDGDTAQ